VLTYASVPLGYDMYPEVQLLFIRGHGIITQGERVQAMLAWLRDPRYSACTNALFDISSAESTPKVSDLRALIQMLKWRLPASGPRKLAIVATRPITFIVARAFERLMRSNGIPLQIELFTDRESAWAWLRPDLPVDTIAAIRT
jgi:SpoIIAA-like